MQPAISRPHTPSTPSGANPTPSHVNRLLLLIHMLIGCGKDFATTLRQQPVTPETSRVLQVRFGTSEIARILFRIGRALRLAAALQTQLRQLAATGQDVKTSAEVALAPPPSRGTRSTTTADRRAAGSGTATNNQDDDLFTDQEILALARRGKLGVAIAAICRDLGLVPSLVTRQQWSELADTIMAFGGDFAELIGNVFLRINQCILEASFSKPLSGQAIRELNEAVIVPAPA